MLGTCLTNKTLTTCQRFFNVSFRGYLKQRKLIMTGGRDEFMKLLQDLNIDTDVVEHPEVFTVEAMMPYLEGITGAVGKNLFLKDKKKKGLWLVSALATREINLGALSKSVNAPGGLRFADEGIMVEKLGVSQGCCTPYSLFNDKEKSVKFILDSGFYTGGHERVYFHPMVNTSTLGMTIDSFKKFLAATGHEPILVDFDNL